MSAFSGLMGQSSYAAASMTSVELGAYRPALQHPDSALLPERGRIDSRVRDMARNSGWLAGGARKLTDKLLGGSIRPLIRPDATALGITPDQAQAVGRQMEAAFLLAARDPRKSLDAARRLSFGQMARVLFWHWKMDGRSLAVPLWKPRRGATYSTCFKLVDPFRLCNPMGKQDDHRLRGGIEIDGDGEHLAYHIKVVHPGAGILADAGQAMRWERIGATTRWGRPKVIYGFEQRQAEMTAGVTMIVSALKKLKMLENYDDYELQAAAIKAVFGMFVKSGLPSEAIFKALSMAPDGDDSAIDSLADYSAFARDLWESQKHTFDGVRVAHMAPGEDIGTIAADRAGGDFVDGVGQWLRYFCTALPGLSYEEVSNNFTETSYVGIRAGIASAEYSLNAERVDFADQMLTPMLDLLMEEAFDQGRVELPSGAPPYEEARGAWCNVEWVGPGRMVVDPQKEANAARIALESGQMTLEEWLSDTGVSVEQHVAQLAREQELMVAAGLPPILKAAQAASLASAQDDEFYEDDREAEKPVPKPAWDGDGDGATNEDDGDDLMGGEF